MDRAQTTAAVTSATQSEALTVVGTGYFAVAGTWDGAAASMEIEFPGGQQLPIQSPVGTDVSFSDDGGVFLEKLPPNTKLYFTLSSTGTTSIIGYWNQSQTQ